MSPGSAGPLPNENANADTVSGTPATAADPNPKDARYSKHWAKRNVIVRLSPCTWLQNEATGFEQYPRADETGNDVYQITFDLFFGMLRSVFALPFDDMTSVLVLAQESKDYVTLYCDKCTDAVEPGEYFLLHHSVAQCRSAYVYAPGSVRTAIGGVTWIDGKAMHTNMPLAEMGCFFHCGSLEPAAGLQLEDSRNGGEKQAVLREHLGIPPKGGRPEKRPLAAAEHPRSRKKGKLQQKPKVDGRGGGSGQMSESKAVGGDTDSEPSPSDKEVPPIITLESLYHMMDKKIDALEGRMEEKFAGVDTKLQRMTHCLLLVSENSGNWHEDDAEEAEWLEEMAKRDAKRSGCWPSTRNAKFRTQVIDRSPQCLLTQSSYLPVGVPQLQLPRVGYMLSAAHVIPHARWDLFDHHIRMSVKMARLLQLPTDSPRINEDIDVNVPENGLLLRHDLHIAFDRFFWSIHPTQLRIIVFVNIPYLLPFHGRFLFPDGARVPHFFPTEAILRWHWQQCLLRRLKAAAEHPEDKYYLEENADLCAECGVDNTECAHAGGWDIGDEEESYPPSPGATFASLSESGSTHRSSDSDHQSIDDTSDSSSNSLVDGPNVPKRGSTILRIGDMAPQ